MIWVWTGIVVFTLIIEFFTSELVSIWFSTAGIVSLMLAIIGVQWYFQVGAFVVVSIILLFALRKFCDDLVKKRYFHKVQKDIIGKKYILMSDLSPKNSSEIKIGDEIWTVVTHTKYAKAGEFVVAYKVKKNKVYVK